MVCSIRLSKECILHSYPVYNQRFLFNAKKKVLDDFISLTKTVVLYVDLFITSGHQTMPHILYVFSSCITRTEHNVIKEMSDFCTLLLVYLYANEDLMLMYLYVRIFSYYCLFICCCSCSALFIHIQPNLLSCALLSRDILLSVFTNIRVCVVFWCDLPCNIRSLISEYLQYTLTDF